MEDNLSHGSSKAQGVAGQGLAHGEDERGLRVPGGRVELPTKGL
jgi:hypothetical protein